LISTAFCHRQLSTQPLAEHTPRHRRANARSLPDTKTDKPTLGTGEGSRCDIVDAASVSRCADIVRPVCAREVVTKRRYTKRNNQNFTSEKFAKTFSVEIRRRGTAFYFWESTSATRWDGGRFDREG
jgi:hypothetical protein